MNTIKDLAKNWWKDLSNREKAKLTFYFDAVRRWEELFEAEIENIFYNEVIIKWYQENFKSKTIIPISVKISAYLKEHSKEEPALDFKYCKNEIEGGNKCYVQCDHCKEYYAPLEMEQPLSVNKDVEVDEEKDDSELWDEIYSMHPITWETPAVRQVVQYIKQHYTLTKKQ
jgi:hypothetical protein